MAAETFAWKVPVSHFTGRGLGEDGFVRLENPPETSPFFNGKDTLWDASSVLHGDFGIKGDLLEWVVWNETTGRLVAKGDPISIFTLHYHLDFQGIPAQCRNRIDLFRVSEDGSPPDFSGKPDASLSMVTRSGQKATASFSKDEARISFEGESTISEDNSLIDLRLLVSASLTGCPEIEINTAAAIRNRSSLWIAREFDGKRGMDVRISTDIELLDGTPMTQATLRQEGNTAKPFGVDRSQRKPVTLEDGASLVFAWADFPTIVSLFDKAPSGDGIDPFAEEDSEITKTALGNLLRAPTPGILAPYFAGPVIDLTGKLNEIGLALKGKDFAGYDPNTARVFLYSSNKAELDKFESLFAVMDCGSAKNTVIATRGNGEMRLIARSGQKAVMKSTDPASKRTRDLEIEPTIGENDELVDLRVVYEEKSEGKLTCGINTSATLQAGKFATLMEGDAGNAPAGDFGLKVDVVEIEKHP